MSHLSLEKVDADGAIRDAAEAAGLDRSDFLKKGVLAGGGLFVGGAIFTQYLSPAEAAISKKTRSKANDVKILNYALTLEYLEAAFYKKAVANKVYGADAPLKLFAQTVAKHEAGHVVFLKSVLKSKAIKSPKFDFGAAVTDPKLFAMNSQLLEDTGVSAYVGQIANISQSSVARSAGKIATVEARHASWIRFINGALPAPDTFDKARSEDTILRNVGKTGFIKK
ncbi:MAG: ferritin-like domain-containing protein [Solirubrobacteraceae bacterium]